MTQVIKSLTTEQQGHFTFTIRSVFIVNPDKIRLVMAYPASTGRNTAEVLLVIDSVSLE